MAENIYLRLKRNVEVTEYKLLRLEDICLIIASDDLLPELKKTPIYRVTKEDLEVIVIDVYMIIENLMRLYPEANIQTVGPSQSIIRMNQKRKRYRPFLAMLVWVLLFIGTAMTIMNFHYDVSMQEVQQKLHFILQGENNEFPLWIQIPYSLGLGIGTLLFFNHIFKKKFNEEPSPLELEVSNYQKQIDEYVSLHENTINDENDSSKSP